jgi:peptide/nickel transport system substrate-binding protein
MRTRIVQGRVVVVALCLLAVTGATGAFGTAVAASGGGAPRSGGSVTYGIEAETGGGWCIPTARLAISGIEVASAIYDTLTVLNSKGETKPYLAKSVTHDDTYTQWTITLRPGVKFHDGADLTADAVRQNIEAWKRGTILAVAFADVTAVTVVDPLTVRVTTAKPWVDFDSYLFFDGRSAIVAPAQLADPATCPTNLIGTGPFVLDHWTPNQEFVANRNPDYWQEDAKGTPLPYLDSITFRPVREAAQRTNQLQGGQVDVVHTYIGSQIQALRDLGSQVNLLQQKPGRRDVRFYQLNTAKPPLDDVNARKAVAMAIDRKAINEIRNLGLFTIANGPFDSAVPGYLKKTGFPNKNLDESRRLVEEYKATHGGSFEVTLEHTDDPENSDEAQLIQQQLTEVGIDANLRQDDQTAFINQALLGNFSILLFRSPTAGDPGTYYPFWQQGSLLNFGKFADPTLQGLLDQARSEPDPATRKQIYEQVNQRFGEQVYNVWSYFVTWVIASRPDVNGLAGPPLPDGGGKPAFLYGRHPVLGLWLEG